MRLTPKRLISAATSGHAFAEFFVEAPEETRGARIVNRQKRPQYSSGAGVQKSPRDAQFAFA